MVACSQLGLVWQVDTGKAGRYWHWSRILSTFAEGAGVGIVRDANVVVSYDPSNMYPEEHNLFGMDEYLMFQGTINLRKHDGKLCYERI